MTPYVTIRTRNVHSHYFPWISQNCPELCGILRGEKIHRNVFISVWKFSGNKGNWGKTIRKKLRHGNEFISAQKFCGNEGNWGKLCGEKTEAWKWVYFCMEFCGNEGNWGKIMYSIIFIYVSLIGNKTSPPTKNSSNLRNIWGGGA